MRQGTTANPVSLTTCGIPLILMAGNGSTVGMKSSGTVGGFTLTTTTAPIAYPSAYCYLPANAMGATLAAGWYYAIFSSTSAGTLYNNVYSSGVPAPPATATAFAASTFTDATWLTQSVTEIASLSLTIPANSMGKSGQIEFVWSADYTNDGNSKTLKVKFGGTTLLTTTLSTTVSNQQYVRIANRGATNLQVCGPPNSTSGLGSSTSTLSASSIDTTADTTLAMSQQIASNVDMLILDNFLMRIMTVP